MSLRIPKPLKEEHHELHMALAAALDVPGPVGAAARAVARKLHPHFVKEEEYALPPLGLLADLAAGRRVTGGTATKARAMTARLKRDLPEMLAEHRAIVRKLNALAAAAKSAKKPEYARLAAKIVLHAQTEEEVLYPAAILVGKMLHIAKSETRNSKPD